MRRKLMLMVGSLLLVFILSACSFFKGSRANIEKQFEVLGEIYPTKNVNDLRKKFPEGFRLVNIRNIGKMTYSVIIENTNPTSEITGRFIVEEDKDGISNPELSAEIELEIDNKGQLIPLEEIPVKYTNEFDNFDFLFEGLDLSKKSVQTFDYYTHNTNATNQYFITYDVPISVTSSILESNSDNYRLSLNGHFGADEEHYEKYIELWNEDAFIRESIRSKGQISRK